jgi:hypothetical protein
MSNNLKRIFVLLCGIKKGDKGLGKKKKKDKQKMAKGNCLI